jgi:hypothetical protein
MGDGRQRGEINLLDQRAPTPASQIYFPLCLLPVFFNERKRRGGGRVLQIWSKYGRILGLNL